MSRLLCLSSPWVRSHVPAGFHRIDRAVLSGVLRTTQCGLIGRNAAESDENYKQVVTYCLVRCGESYLVYGRGQSGGEPRLDGRLSLGVGGHVEESDVWGPAPTFSDVEIAARREITEELYLEWPTTSFTFRGLVNHDEDAVGRVHLGFVWELSVPSTRVRPREASIDRPAFYLPALFPDFYPRFERWSQFIADDILRPAMIGGCDGEGQDQGRIPPTPGPRPAGQQDALVG